MKHKKLQEALDQISDKYIEEAVQKPKRKFWRWAAPIAALLVFAILLSIFAIPQSSENNVPPPDSHYSNFLLASPVYPQMAPMPNWDHYSGSGSDGKWNEYDIAWDAWREGQKAQYDQPEGYADGTEAFFGETIHALLGNADGKNAVCSPVNIYMALAMLAQATNGETRQEILDVLSSPDIDTLQIQAGHVWNAHYSADEATFLTLANSLWLDSGLAYNQATADILADIFYASVFQGDLGSENMNEALRNWINNQTGGLLREQAEQLSLDDQTVLALASTIYYRCKWTWDFWDGANTDGSFHSPGGDMPVTYMHMGLDHSYYYWGDKFGAIAYPLEDGSKMWLILPDEGITPEALAGDSQVMALLQDSSYENKKTGMIINLSLPQFDICSDLDLRESLQAMGIRSVFTDQADFSAILPEQTGVPGMNPYLSGAKHAARVAIDEEGITAAAYTVLEAAGAAPPPDKEMDFILDRPFLFVVESRDGLPLFAGIVNQP